MAKKRNTDVVAEHDNAEAIVETTETTETQDTNIEESEIQETTEVVENVSNEIQETTEVVENNAVIEESAIIDEFQEYVKPISVEHLQEQIAELTETNRKLTEEVERLKNAINNSITYKYALYQNVYFEQEYQRKLFTVFAHKGASIHGPLYKLYCKADETQIDLVPEIYLTAAI